MSIRVRLIFVSLLVAVPTVGLVFGILVGAETLRTRAALVDWLDLRVHDAEFQAKCRSGWPVRVGDLYGWPPATTTPAPPSSTPVITHRNRYRFFAFDETLQGPLSAVSVVPREALQRLAAETNVTPSNETWPRQGIIYTEPGSSTWYVRRTGLAGNCAVVAAAGPAWPRSADLDRWRLLVLFAGVFVAALASGGPIVRRVRSLTRAVRESSDAGYEHPIPVEGRDEFAALARTFNDAGAGLRRQLAAVADREAMLREFVANTGHDVATPLSVLQGHLSTLESREDLTAEARADVAAAIREAHFAGSILRNLAAMAKLDTPGWVVAIAPLDLVTLVERVVLRHQPLARASGVEIAAAVPHAPAVIDADVTLLEQALSNLVDNAVRYNRPGGHVGITLDRAIDRFVLRVVDDGPGVTDTEMAALGNREFRSDEARSRRPGGQGLGLDIACGVVCRLGFSIEFRRSAAGGLEVDIVGRVSRDMEDRKD